MCYWEIQSAITVLQHTHPELEDGTDRFVVTETQAHVTAITQLPNLLTTPQDSVTPRWSATLCTATSHVP